jgi:hypothetical protein
VVFRRKLYIYFSFPQGEVHSGFNYVSNLRQRILITNATEKYVVTSLTPVENSTGILIAYYVSFVLFLSPAFSRIPFQRYMLSNDSLRPTFNVIFHE